MRIDSNSSTLVMENVNDVIKAHIGWAKYKANHFSKYYHVDFDDVFSYALESIWRAISYETEEGCNRNIRWFAAIFLKRRIIDMVRKAHMGKRRISFKTVNFDDIHAGSVTFITADNYHFEPREPCVECGTTGGAAFSGRNHAARCHGCCLACYHRYYDKAKKEKQNRLQVH